MGGIVMSIKIYVKDGCPQCNMTERLFDQLECNFEVINITHNEDAQQRLIKEGWLALPVVKVEPEGISWSGFQPNNIKKVADN